jgi:ketosteroid isomerase-like protein
MKDAINKGDVERELTYLHPNVVVTWHNAELSRGRDGVRSYLNRILNGPNKMVASYTADVEADELTILYGGTTGVSFGSATEHFKLANGKTLDLPARWSATLVKEGDQWLIASLHASDNLFDNPMLSTAKRMIYYAASGGLVLGIIAGFLLGRRKRPA